jgi:anti-sigma-K factor RskA
MASVGVERSRWSWAAALAAVCMLVVALWLSVEERQRTADLAAARQSLIRVQAERDRMLQALSFLNQPETRQVGFGKGEPAPPRGNVFVNPRSGVLMIASNLPKLAAGRVFEMWIIPKGGAPRPAGLFQSDTAGAAFHILAGPVDLRTLDAVAVSVEPDTGSPAPTTTPIIIAPVASP